MKGKTMRGVTARALAGSLVLGVLLVGSMVLGAAAPAAAVTADPLDVADIRHLDFETPNNAAAYKTSVPASVIRDASRVKAARGPAGGYAPVAPAAQARTSSQIASSQRQTRAAAALSRNHGANVKDWIAAQSASPKAGPAIASVKSKFRVPATSLAKFGKVLPGAGAALSMVTAAQMGFQVGKGISSAMGLDVEGGLCQPTFGGDWVATVTGTACPELFVFAEDYIPNQGIIAGISLDVCTSGASPICINYRGDVNFYAPAAGQNLLIPCFRRSDQPGGSGIFGLPADIFVSTDNGATFVNRGRSSVSSSGSVWHSGCHAFGGNSSSASFTPANMAPGNRYRLGVGGTPVEATRTSTDPTRTLECVIAGSNSVTYRALSEPYVESSGAIPEPVCPALPDGVTANNVKVNQNTPGLAPSELYNEDTTPAFRELNRLFPECATGLCFADLRKVMPGTTTGTASCFDDLSDAACVDWHTDPNKAATYQCHYGGQLVALSECDHYAPTFKAERRAAGQAYADPGTGALPVAGSAPATGDSFGQPVRDPASDRKCFPTGWAALNPLEWVFKPVGCALEWAFVPRASVLATQVQGLEAQWAASPPGQIARQVTSLAPAVVPNGCEGLPMHLGWVGSVASSQGVNFSTPQTVYLLEACPGDVLHPWSIGVNLVLSGGILLVGIKTSLALVGRMANYSGIDAA